MKNVFYALIICFAAGLSFGCSAQPLSNSDVRPAPKNSCEISEEDAKKHLGETVFLLDKAALMQILDSEAKTDAPELRACAYVTKEGVKEIPYLEWLDREFESAGHAKNFFETTFKNNPPKKSFDAVSHTTENLSGIGDDAIITEEERAERKETTIIARKGKNTFILKKAVGKSKTIPADEMKALAKKIADKIPS